MPSHTAAVQDTTHEIRSKFATMGKILGCVGGKVGKPPIFRCGHSALVLPVRLHALEDRDQLETCGDVSPPRMHHGSTCRFGWPNGVRPPRRRIPLPANSVERSLQQMPRTADEYAVLAERVIAARADARPGDILVPAFAATLRSKLGRAAAHAGFSPSECLPPTCSRAVNVHDQFAWVLTLDLPPRVAGALPGIPPPFEFALAGTTLLLVDTELDLVIDVLPDAFRQSLPLRNPL